MDSAKLAKAALPASLVGYLRKTSSSHGDHGGHGSGARVAVHNGHTIVLETIYRVTVDGREVDLGISVDDGGQVHCHSLPNYQFASALDMVKTLVDQFPDDFRKSRPRGKAAHGHAAPRKPAAKSRRKPTRGKSR